VSGARYEIHIPASGSGGGSNPDNMPIVLNRRNHSVNDGLIDNWDRTMPVMLTNTTVNNVGGYNGGGTGNKAILGHWLPGPLVSGTPIPLGMILGLSYTIEQLTPEAGQSVLTIPYLNLLVELDPVGFPGSLSILVMGQFGVAINTGTFSSPGPNQHSMIWTPGANFASVVLDKGMGGASPGPIPLFGPNPIPPAEGPPPPPNSTWSGRDYSIASILVAYPGARVVNGPTGDGGMPKLTDTSALMMIIGDSTFMKQNEVRVLSFKLNGAEV